MNGGDCLSCSRTTLCRETTVDRLLLGYTCSLFTPTPEAVYHARVDMMLKFGTKIAAEAIVAKPKEEEE